MEGLRYSISAGSAVEALPDHVLLFSPGAQEIYRLNASSAVLAERLIEGATAPELERLLEDLGLDRPGSTKWVAAFLGDLADLMLLECARSAAPPAAPRNQRIAVAGVAVQIVYETEDLFAAIAPAYAHLACDGEGADITYRVAEAGEFVLVGGQSERWLVVQQARAAVQLKGMILEAVLKSANHLFALHAACLCTADGCVLLLGEPGAGKSTLALALRDAGFAYQADDVTLVHEDGRVTGLPFAPAAKQGTWDIVRNREPGLEALRGHLRPDGQTVRFLPLAAQDWSARCPVKLVVKLRRSELAQTRFAPIAAADAIGALLEEARSPSGSCSADIFRAAVALVRHARCVELHYAEAAEGAQTIRAYDHG